MSVWRLVAREIVHRKGSFVLGVVCVAAATMTMVGGWAFFAGYDLETRAIVDASRDDLDARILALDEKMRKAMLRLGFNITILPAGQDLGDWHAEDYASKRMPEGTLERLAAARPVKSGHFLAALRRKATWPEKKWTVIMVGTAPDIIHPLADAHELSIRHVARGEMHVGFEIHQGLSLEEGGSAELMGKRLRIGKCLDEKGGRDDVTVWLHLDDARELFGMAGAVNEIMALASPEGLRDLPGLKAEIAEILPGVQVVENSAWVQANRLVRTKVAEEGKAAIARVTRERAELRERAARIHVAVGIPVALLCGAWIVLSALGNVRDRRDEIGILLAMGYSSRRVGGMCLLRFCLIGLAGALLGVLPVLAMGGLNPGLVLGIVCLATGMTSLSAWMPVTIETWRDPAMILRK